MASRAKVAIVHDYLTQRGGAERVVLAMLRAFPGAEVHTSLYDPAGTFPAFGEFRVRTLALNSISPLRHHHRAAFPLLAPSFSAHAVDAEVTICSSSGWAHGVRALGRKLVYCYTPARWLYQTERYLGDGTGVGNFAKRAGITLLRPPLRGWDRSAARSAERYIVMSKAVQQRVRIAYGLDAEIIPPPVTDLTSLVPTPVRGILPGFLLCISRLLPYKNVDVLLRAMARLPEFQMVIVGSGPEAARLRDDAPSNVVLAGTVSDSNLAWLFANCRATVAPSYEDFGLIPVEAAMFGKPTAALAWGGFLDTVIDGQTGVLFEGLSIDRMTEAIRDVATQPFSASRLRSHARGFRESVFAQRLRAAIAG